MRLFIFARHGESAANVARVVSSNPPHGGGLTARGRTQARRFGTQIANLEMPKACSKRSERSQRAASAVTGLAPDAPRGGSPAGPRGPPDSRAAARGLPTGRDRRDPPA